MDSPRELEWYLRDHFFKEAGKGRTHLARSEIGSNMVGTYLRYRGYDPQELDRLMSPVIDHLISLNVIHQNGDTLMSSSVFFRMQCGICYYVNYLTDGESLVCQRCFGTALHEFPKKK